MKIVIYSWFGDDKTVAPYTDNTVIEGDLWPIVQDFYDKGMNVMVKHGNDITDYGKPCPILYVSAKGFTTG